MSLEIKFLGAESSCPFPIPDRAWEIFSTKGIKAVFLSIGSSASALPDLELAESLGCPINIVPLKEAHREAWTEVAAILKSRKREDGSAAFSAGAEKKWILPKNIRIQSSFPWWTAGTADLSGSVVATEPFLAAVDRICKEIKTKNGETRLDILKVDTADTCPGLESSILAAALNAGVRPALVLVNWSRAPDTDLMITSAAGHLQNSGYRLLGKAGNRFVYYFTDNDLYQTCSWEDEHVMNPLVNEIIKSYREAAATAKAKEPTVPQTKPEPREE